MNHNLEIQKLLIKTNEALLPQDKLNFIKQAIVIADAHNDLQWGYDLRISLIDEESNTTRCKDSFAAFAWVLDAYDSDPELFDVGYLLGKYRWMISEAYRNVNISMGQIHQMVKDFKKRLQNEGYSLRTYYSVKIDLGFYFNNTEMILKNLNARDKEEVNTMFDYWLGEVYANIEFTLREGKIEAAARIEREASLTQLEYKQYPLAIYASFIRYLTWQGKYEKAYEYFLKAEECLPSLGHDQSPITSISKLIHFLSIYNKADKAWLYFEEYVNWTVNSDDCTAAFFAMDVLYLLKTHKGERVLHVSDELPWYRPDNTYQIAKLYDYYNNLATSLSKRFDARNANDTFMKRLKRAQNPQSTNWFGKFWRAITKKTR